MAIFTAAGVGAFLGVASSSLLATVSAAALNAAVGIGLSLASTALQQQDMPPVGGVRGQIETGGDVPRSIILGQRASAGSLAYAGTWGNLKKTPNAYLVQVIALSDVPVRGLAGIEVNGETCEIDYERPHADGLGFPVTEYSADGRDNLWIKFYDGTQTAADPYLVANFGTHPTYPYQSTRVGRGVAYAIMTARVQPELFSGFPKFRFVVNGAKLYDPSRDSTVGGVGAQRWNQPATWGGDGDNLPVVQSYNLLRGVTYDGKWLYGVQGMPAARLPATVWIGQIAKCRANVPGPDGDEAQYLTGIEITVDTELGDVIDAIMMGAHGRLMEAGGVYKPRVGEPGAPVMAITDGDILTTDPQSFKPFATLANSINGITATYPEPKEAWAMKAAKPLYSPAYEARDGGRRLVSDLKLDAVSRWTQVDRIMKAALAEARRERRHTLSLPPWAWVLETGDVIAWTSDRNSYASKSFRIDGIVDKTNLDVTLDVVEVDPSDFTPPTSYVPPVFVPITPVYPPAQAMEGWAAEAATVPDAGGNARRPAIRVSCDPDQDDVQQVHVRVRVKSTSAVVFDSSATAYAPPYSWILAGAWALPSTVYQVQGRFVPYSNRETAWSAWIDVLTPDIRITKEDLDAEIVAKLDELEEWLDDGLIEDINDRIAAILAQLQDQIDTVNGVIDQVNGAVELIDRETQDRISGAIEAARQRRSLIDTIASIRDYAANADYANYAAREELRRTITVRLEGAVATFDERITAAVSANAAIVERLTTFDVRVNGLSANITQIDTARIQGQEALAQQIAAISVGTDNQFDPFKGWYFDSTIEGWSGNGAPTVSGGFLRPADNPTDPYVTSPVGLAVTGNAYRQVRARIRKVGSPVWEGQLWWAAPTDAAWDVGRRLTISEPAFDTSGIGLITFNPSWTGTIDRIRLDLSTAQSGSDYYTIDWIAIGSPSPGASRAELIAERTARISGDTAIASSVTALQAVLTDAQTQITGVAGAVSSLEGTVTSINGVVTAHSTAITGINAELTNKASVDAVSQLEAEVEALGGGGIVSQGQAITAIRNSFNPLASEIADAEFAAFLRDQDIRKVQAEASQTLTTRIEQTASSLDILSQAVTRVQAIIPDLASATAISTLTARVTVVEGFVTSQADAITSINATLGTKASTAALTSLTTRVTTAEGSISAISGAITSINAGLADKASISAVNALTGRVTTTEGLISSQADALTSLSNIVDGKASGTAVSSLTTRVTQTETVANSKIRVFRQSATPVATAVGDLWIRTGEGNRLYRASAVGSGNWVLSEDQRIPDLVTITTAQSAAITSINSALDTKASAAALTSLTTQVTSVEGIANSKNRVFRQNATPNALAAGDIWFKTNDSNRPYRASAPGTDNWVLTEDTRIPGLMTTTQALSESITQISSDLGGKASSTAVTALTTRVSSVEGAVSAQADAITSIQSQANGATAQAKFRMTTATGPDGYTRIAAQARYDAGAGYRNAGFYIDVPASSGEDTSFLVDADRFAIRTGNTSKRVPFLVSGGVVRMNIADIGLVTAGIIRSADGKSVFNLTEGFLSFSD